MTAPASHPGCPRYVLRGQGGEGYLRALVALPGLVTVRLEVMHVTAPAEALHFCTAKAARRFAVAVAAHYPLTLHGRYEVLRHG